jgi:HPr kinase/phosphorylase
MAALVTTVHASAVLVGTRAVVIRGPSGSGKSRLALALIEAGRSGALMFARLVGDDRIFLNPAGGRVLVRPADALAGLIEVRGVGLLRLDYEPAAVAGLVVDLATAAKRRPDEAHETIEICGVQLPRLAVAEAAEALPGAMARITSSPNQWA